MSFAPAVPAQFPLTRSLTAEIGRIGRLRAPREACGLILPAPGDTSGRSGIAARVIELPNRSMSAGNEYEMHGQDIMLELERWLADATPQERKQMILWHTHPSGNEEPSRGDYVNRSSIDFAMVVVALKDDGDDKATFF